MAAHETRLTHDPADDWQASWSPDSTRLAFISARDGEWEIYLMDVSDGGIAGDSQLVRLTDNEVADGFPDWSPDGTRIVFSSMRDGNEEIYVMNADGSNPQRLTFNDYDESFPRWSPDGLRIAYTIFSPVSQYLQLRYCHHERGWQRAAPDHPRQPGGRAVPALEAVI